VVVSDIVKILIGLNYGNVARLWKSNERKLCCQYDYLYCYVEYVEDVGRDFLSKTNLVWYIDCVEESGQCAQDMGCLCVL
jgi:hypothetical protein